MKRILSIFLSAAIMLSMLCIAPSAAFSDEVGGKCGDSLNWSFDTSSGVLTLSGTGRMYDYEDESAPAPWMNSYGTQIKSVVCESGVTSVGSKAFMNCTSLESVDLGDTMDIIGYYAFRGCTSLGGVAIPDSVTQTWPGCFENCTSIAWVNFGTGLTEIAGWSFAGCNSSSFWWVSLPENITVIGEHAFDGCSNLGWNTIAGKNITFGEHCFKDISAGATFIISDRASKDYLYGYYNGWSFSCIDDKHTSGKVVNVKGVTCTEQGYITYECGICGTQFNTEFVDPLGHNYNTPVLTSDDYYYSYSCSRCGDLRKVSAVTLNRKFNPHLSSFGNNADYDRIFDVNSDGVINMRDYSRIYEHIADFNTQRHATTVNTSSTHQTMLGFGASACWWAQCVGGWDDAKINEIMTLLYDKDKGIGLNIYRYNLGAGSENDEALYIKARRAECFLKPDGTYDWNADANARKCLEYAKNIYGDDLRVTLFSNSAPVQFTINGRAYCDFVPEGANYKSNLSSSNYTNHANFVVKCAEHFTDLGYRVTNISPINEPEWEWDSDNAENTSAGQEGCHFDKKECRDFYKKCISAINGSPIKDTCKIEMWESGQMGNSTFESYLEQMLGKKKIIDSYENKELRNYFDTISFHSYWAGENDRKNTATLLNGSDYNSYKRAITEYCQMDGSSSGLGIDKGIELADTIYQDLTILDVEEWDWWVAVAEGGYMDGLLYTDYQNEQSNHDVTTSKRLWVMGNYAKFTNEGSVRVDVTCNIDGVKTCAFDNHDGTVTIVYINTTPSDEITNLDSQSYKSFSTYVTDETHDLEAVQSSVSSTSGVFIPANSVTTVVASTQ